MSAERPPSRANGFAADTPPATGWLGGDDPADVEADADEARTPSIAGFVTGRLLGRGGSASVWLVTDSAGQRFALKIPHAALRPSQQVDGQPMAHEARAVEPIPGRRARRAAPSSGAVATPKEDPGERPAAQPTARSGQGIDALEPAGGDALLREVRLLQHLRHDHLLRLHGVIVTDQGPALLMDLAVGGSLLDLVRTRGPLPVAEVVTILVPMAQALGYLHAAGAMHGDVTPGNILFTHEGKPLLCDFGTGRLLGSEPLAMPGTSGFVDPATTTAYDSGVDVFALAAVSWFALTGRIPGPAEQRPPLTLIVPEVPDALMHLIEDGLSSSRERRPSAASFARTLLSTSPPHPVDLVSAVHASVLPELLTRRSESRPAEPTSRWGRLIARRRARRRATGVASSDGIPGSGPGSIRRPRPAPARRFRPESVHRPGDGSRRGESRDVGVRSGADSGQHPEREVGVLPRRRERRISDGSVDGRRHIRSVLAVASGCTAVVLLVVGVALTIGGLRWPERDPRESAVQGEASGRRLPSAGQTDPLADPPAGPGEVQGGGGRDGEGTSSEAPNRADGPVAALQELVDLRAAAFGEADAEILREVDVESSPAMAADQRSVDALEQSGTGLRDLSIAVREATLLTDSEVSGQSAAAALPGIAEAPIDVDIAAVRATMQISSYTTESSPAEAGSGERRQDGTENTEVVPPPLMAAGQQELVFVLWDTEEGWRIHSVVEPW